MIACILKRYEEFSGYEKRFGKMNVFMIYDVSRRFAAGI